MENANKRKNISFVMRGEKKIPVEQYRWLMSTVMEFAKYQLEKTSNDVDMLHA